MSRKGSHSNFEHPLSSFPISICLVPGLQPNAFGGHLETMEQVIVGHPRLSIPLTCILANGGHLGTFGQGTSGCGTFWHSFLGHPLSSLPTVTSTIPGIHPNKFGGHLETMEQVIFGHPFSSFPSI